MSEWEIVKAEEILDVQNGYAFKAKHFHESEGIPVIKIKNVASGELDMNDVQFYPLSVDDLERYFINEGDILIALTGSHISQPSSVVGRVAKYNNNEISLLNQRVGKIYSLDNQVADEEYIYWYFKQWDVTLELALNAGGSANQANISGKLIKSLDILLPSLPEQKAIASVLSSLDSKIDLLHRQNQTLEAMAETLFRQWFVEEAEEDWEEEPLSDIAEFLNGKACQKYPPKNPVEKLPVLKIKELKNGITDSSDWASTEVGDEYIIENGDVIFSWSASLLVKIWDGETCILNQHLFKVTSDRFPKWFYYLWSKYHLDRFQAIARAQATTMGHIRRKDLDEAMVSYTKDRIEEKDEAFEPVISKIVSNNQQITKLEDLRETLLPKLMSGEIRVN